MIELLYEGGSNISEPFVKKILFFKINSNL